VVRAYFAGLGLTAADGYFNAGVFKAGRQTWKKLRYPAVLAGRIHLDERRNCHFLLDWERCQPLPILASDLRIGGKFG
jgi:hypothetical protein